MRIANRQAECLSGGDAQKRHVSEGHVLLTELRSQHPEFCGHEVRQTTGYGSWFLQAILQQLEMFDPGLLWKLAMIIVNSLPLFEC